MKHINKLIFIQILNFFHFIDEYFFNFPSWATFHFGTTTDTYYLISHSLIVLIIIIILLNIKKEIKVSLFLLLVIQTIFFTNGIFHIFTTLLWSEYSPGLISQILIIPNSIITYKIIKKSKIISKNNVLKAFYFGSILSLLIILSLFFNIDI